MNKIKVIFWDFDGVILNSNEFRDSGFEIVLKDFPKNQVELLLNYHHQNGGLSRYVKFRYFFEVIRGEKVSNKQIQDYSSKFSEIMLNILTNKDLLINDSLSFIKENKEKYRMHIVSGSDGKELNLLCKYLGIHHYFETINGSPEIKINLVKKILDEYDYKIENCVLIGDSINDHEAAIINKIKFLGYNYFQGKENVTILNSFSEFNTYN